LQEVEALRQEKLEIDQQIRSIHGSTLGSMQNFPIQRRNDRWVSIVLLYIFHLISIFRKVTGSAQTGLGGAVANTVTVCRDNMYCIYCLG